MVCLIFSCDVIRYFELFLEVIDRKPSAADLARDDDDDDMDDDDDDEEEMDAENVDDEEMIETTAVDSRNDDERKDSISALNGGVDMVSSINNRESFTFDDAVGGGETPAYGDDDGMCKKIRTYVIN